MASSIKKYAVIKEQLSMQESESGNWVKLEDYEQLLKDKNSVYSHNLILREELRDMIRIAKSYGWKERDDGSDE